MHVISCTIGHSLQITIQLLYSSELADIALSHPPYAILVINLFFRMGVMIYLPGCANAFHLRKKIVTRHFQLYCVTKYLVCLLSIKQIPSESKTRALLFCYKKNSWTVLCFKFQKPVGNSSYLQ